MPAYHVPQIDHAAYPKMCRRKSDAELVFTIADCRSALAANPDGDKASYYADEICYAAEELQRRGRGGRRTTPTVGDIAAAAAACALELCNLAD